MAAGGQQRVTPVDQATRQRLRPDATVLYQPLPPTVSGVRQLLRFGMRNNRADLWRLGLTAALVAGIVTVVVRRPPRGGSPPGP